MTRYQIRVRALAAIGVDVRLVDRPSTYAGHIQLERRHVQMQRPDVQRILMLASRPILSAVRWRNWQRSRAAGQKAAPTVKPSQVELSFPHFVGCAGRAEREFALALYVRACEVKGDKWQPLVPRDIGEVLKADHESKVEPWVKLTQNPFWFPDFPDLVQAGYARWLGEGKGSAVELTAAGAAAIDKWVGKAGRRRP